MYTRQAMDQHTFLYTLSDLLFIGQDNIVNDLFLSNTETIVVKTYRRAYQWSKQSPSSGETLQTKVTITKSA